VKQLRSQGLTPANIFGKKIDSLNNSVDSKTFIKFASSVGESTLVYLQLDSEKDTRPVLIREIVRHPVTGQVLHVTFNQVNLKEKVSAPVPVELIGEPVAEKEKLGIMVQQLDELEIRALPTDMPEHVQIDVTGLAEVGAHIKVSDLKLDSKLEVETDPDTTIVQIEALAKEEVAPVVVPAAEEGLPAEAEAKEGEALPAEDKKEESKEK